jgi:hypothetical protein
VSEPYGLGGSVEESYDLPGVPQQGPGHSAQPPAPRVAPDAGAAAVPQDGAQAAQLAAQPSAEAGSERPPEPLGVTVAPTGNPEVDAAVERLGDADELPTDAHIEVYEDVHAALRQSLAALDENRG